MGPVPELGWAPVDTSPAVPVPPPIPPAAAPPSPLERPRVWTVFVAFMATYVAAIAVSGVVLGIVVATRLSPGSAGDPDAVRTVASAAVASGGFMIGTALATAMSEVLVAVVAGALSRERLSARLAIGRSRLAPRTFAVATLGAIAASSTFDAAFGALGREQAGSVERLARVVAGLSPTGLAAMLFVAGLVAPIAEELFFRGYVQTRLCRRFGAWPGVVFASVLFGLVHLDWVQSPSAFLIGLYLGWLAQRTGSIRPSMLAHAANIVVWMLATWAHLGTGLARPAHAALLILYTAALVLGVRWLRPRIGNGTREPESASSAPELA
jgi:membrane protease YdiL (CAAX protease family)